MISWGGVYLLILISCALCIIIVALWNFIKSPKKLPKISRNIPKVIRIGLVGSVIIGLFCILAVNLRILGIHRGENGIQVWLITTTILWTALLGYKWIQNDPPETDTDS